MAKGVCGSLGSKATTATGVPVGYTVDISHLDSVVAWICTTSSSYTVSMEISMDGTSFVAGPGSSSLTNVNGYLTYTLPVALLSMNGELGANFQGIMALAVLVTLPIAVLFLIAQKRVMAGMAAGAVKG